MLDDQLLAALALSCTKLRLWRHAFSAFHISTRVISASRASASERICSSRARTRSLGELDDSVLWRLRVARVAHASAAGAAALALLVAAGRRRGGLPLLRLHVVHPLEQLLLLVHEAPHLRESAVEVGLAVLL